MHLLFTTIDHFRWYYVMDYHFLWTRTYWVVHLVFNRHHYNKIKIVWYWLNRFLHIYMYSTRVWFSLVKAPKKVCTFIYINIFGTLYSVKAAVLKVHGAWSSLLLGYHVSGSVGGLLRVIQSGEKNAQSRRFFIIIWTFL